MPDPVLDAECPVCHRPVSVGSNVHMGNAYSGPMMTPRTPEELSGACVVHGRPPRNADTARALEKRRREGQG